MKNLTWQNPEQLFVAQELINKVKSKCCGIKVKFDAKVIREKDIRKIRICQEPYNECLPEYLGKCNLTKNKE